MTKPQRPFSALPPSTEAAIVRIRDLVHPLIIEPAAVIGGDERLGVDAQAVRLHRVEEAVEKRLGQIADQHEFGIVVLVIAHGGCRLCHLVPHGYSTRWKNIRIQIVSMQP